MNDEIDIAEVKIPLEADLLGLEDREAVADAIAQIAHDAVMEASSIRDGIRISRDRRICSGCGNGPFPGTVDLWPEVAYWERPRKFRTAGSGSQGIGRHRTGRWLCESCARKTELGLNAGQGRMIE